MRLKNGFVAVAVTGLLVPLNSVQAGGDDAGFPTDPIADIKMLNDDYHGCLRVHYIPIQKGQGREHFQQLDTCLKRAYPNDSFMSEIVLDHMPFNMIEKVHWNVRWQIDDEGPCTILDLVMTEQKDSFETCFKDMVPEETALYGYYADFTYQLKFESDSSQ